MDETELYMICIEGDAESADETFHRLDEAADFACDLSAQTVSEGRPVCLYRQGEEINRFRHGLSCHAAQLAERARDRIERAGDTDELRTIMVDFARDLGVPELGEISFDESRARLLDNVEFNPDTGVAADVFGRAAEQWTALVNKPGAS